MTAKITKTAKRHTDPEVQKSLKNVNAILAQGMKETGDETEGAEQAPDPGRVIAEPTRVKVSEGAVYGLQDVMISFPRHNPEKMAEFALVAQVAGMQIGHRRVSGKDEYQFISTAIPKVGMAQPVTSRSMTQGEFRALAQAMRSIEKNPLLARRRCAQK